MLTKVKPSFAFLVVTYNHEKYILEHLESIRFLVQTYGADIDIDLIVNDDCSRDQTTFLVDQWLKVNSALFRTITTLFNPKNLGTCASINNMLSHMKADCCKLTAGDDVYSFENIFELTQYGIDVAMISGRALYLHDNSLGVDSMANYLATATQVIYKNNTLLHRFKHFSYNNAPNMLYATECLLHPGVRDYLVQFDVTEDWPLQISIARLFKNRRLILADKVFVYYRRTLGSTYIVENKRFINDKIKIYDDLLQNESNWFEKIRLMSRKSCFKTQNAWVNKFFNVDFYIFILSCLGLMFNIIKCNRNLDMRVDDHQQHYFRIKTAALAMRARIV